MDMNKVLQSYNQRKKHFDNENSVDSNKKLVIWKVKKYAITKDKSH